MKNATGLVLTLVAFAGVMMLTGCQTHEQKEIAGLQGTWKGTINGKIAIMDFFKKSL